MIEFDSRRIKERRKTPCYIEKDRRNPSDRRGKATREIEEKQKKEFNRHLNAQR
jgi:hypothetical protein